MMQCLHWCVHLVLIALLAALVRQQLNQSRSVAIISDNSIPQQQNLDASGSDHLGNTTDERTLVSSIWCIGDHHTNRICRFRNLCYLASENEFVFMHAPDSIFVGLPTNRYDPTLLDMSSVSDHNTQYFNYIDVDASKLPFSLENVTFIDRTSLIFHRFHPDNLMHVLHDDLLPMFYTLLQLPDMHRDDDLDLFSEQLVFAEGWDPGPFQELYEKFTISKPLYMKDLQTENNLVCFRNSYVGLSKHTTWYQYGFFAPQGPISHHDVTAYEIRSFCHFLQARLNIKAPLEHADGHTAVLVSRKFNRLILNEVDLTFALAQALQMKVLNVGIETHSVPEMIGMISNASLLIGMHGSLLSLAMFLPPGAILVELFPYAVNPAHYTPYRTLAGIPGMHITYVPWRNMDIDKTIGHADRSWEEGGIVHLPKEQQMQILSSHEVPLHLCCRDPEWLYRIYQDTVVDIGAVIALIKEVNLTNSFGSNNVIKHANTNRRFPSYVRAILCSGAGLLEQLPSLKISWQPPANIKFIEHKDLKYELWIQEAGKEDYTAWILTKYEQTFTAGIQPRTSYNIWIRCIMDDVNGPFNTNQVSCSTV